MPGVSFAEHVVFFDVQMQMRRYKRDTLSIFLRPTKRGVARSSEDTSPVTKGSDAKEPRGRVCSGCKDAMLSG